MKISTLRVLEIGLMISAGICAGQFITKVFGPASPHTAAVADAGVDTFIDDADGCLPTVTMNRGDGSPLYTVPVMRVQTDTGFTCMIMDLERYRDVR